MAKVSRFILGFGLSKLAVAHPFPTLNTRALLAPNPSFPTLYIGQLLSTTLSKPSRPPIVPENLSKNFPLPVIKLVRDEWSRADVFVSRVRPDGVNNLPKKIFGKR